jgi:hypothetical protein
MHKIKDGRLNLDDFERIISDRSLFNQTIYTSQKDSLEILKKRRKDKDLVLKVTNLLKGGVPDIFYKKNCAIMARQLATPNYDSRMFLSIAKEEGLHPVFLEYFDDKFTSNNQYKLSLGQIQTQEGDDKRTFHKINIVDFNRYDGKKLKEVETVWGESLVDFHKRLFDIYGLSGFSFFEETEWYHKENETSFDFYVNFFLLVTCFGVLFENFLITTDESEVQFTKEVVLPAFQKVLSLTGVKPLIVPVGDLSLENEDFWYYHLPMVEKFIKKSP